MHEVVLFYNGLDVPTRQILDSRGAIPSKTVADVKVAIQEMVEYSQKWHNRTYRTISTKTSDGLAAIQAQLNNLGRKLKKVNEKVYVAQVGCEQCKGDSVSVMPLSTYLNLGLGELAHIKLTVELADRTVKYPKGIVENVLVCICKFVFPVDFIILDMPEDIKVPLILERPFLSTAHAKIDVFKRKITLRVGIKARDDARMISKIFGYPGDCDHNKKIRIDCACNLKFSFMIVLEDMDAYYDEGMGDVIFSEPFLREVGINARRFEGMITIYNGNEEVTYQMVQTHPTFKHHTNEQCNKIPSLLKMSEEDMMNGISHSYQKLKSFYKGVLNLGPEYVRDAKIEEWLTRGHIRVHEIE
uniref:Reverse transcriptase domain-containing protein n=1 Tax=Tanacetum cinerariifolium TaxID=118510 RepID=A0A6L2JHH9_TANCI|nr:hypothetical protein [Tanacetum cinerariifolium]